MSLVLTPVEQFLLIVAAPTVLALSTVEALVLWRREGYDWRAFGVSLFDFVARIALGILLPLSMAGPAVRWALQHRIGSIPLDGWPASPAVAASGTSTGALGAG